MAALRVALAVAVALVAGAATGVSSVALHARWWGLGLAALATAAGLWAAPRRWPRAAFAAGWVLVVGPVVLGRPEGDVLVAADPAGYAVLVGGLAVLTTGLVSLAPPRRGTGPRVGAESEDRRVLP